jgi:large subunit ribosomal protein L24
VDIRKGDEVIVISGDEKGKIGRVLYIYPKTHRVLVEKINMIKRHTRPRSQQQQQGGIIEKEAPVHISNLALYDPKAKRGVRVRHRVRYETDGDRKVKIKDRVSAKTGEVLEKPAHKRS